MSANTDEWYRQRAQDCIHRDGEIEIDDNAVVSTGADRGAYVAAWVWVEDDDKEDGDADD